MESRANDATRGRHIESRVFARGFTQMGADGEKEESITGNGAALRAEPFPAIGLAGC